MITIVIFISIVRNKSYFHLTVVIDGLNGRCFQHLF